MRELIDETEGNSLQRSFDWEKIEMLQGEATSND